MSCRKYVNGEKKQIKNDNVCSTSCICTPTFEISHLISEISKFQPSKLSLSAYKIPQRAWLGILEALFDWWASVNIICQDLMARYGPEFQIHKVGRQQRTHCEIDLEVLIGLLLAALVSFR